MRVIDRADVLIEHLPSGSAMLNVIAGTGEQIAVELTPIQIAMLRSSLAEKKPESQPSKPVPPPAAKPQK